MTDTFDSCFNVFPPKDFAMRLLKSECCSDALQRTLFKIQTHPSKGVQKNILKAWDFTKNKLCQKYIDDNLQKIFRTNILENDRYF